jgi:hypothetical protein
MILDLYSVVKASRLAWKVAGTEQVTAMFLVRANKESHTDRTSYT